MISVFVLFGAGILAAARGTGDSTPDLRISVTQTGEAELKLVYEWKRPQRQIVFDEIAGDYREQFWTIDTPGFELLHFADGDRILRKDEKKFTRVEITARPGAARLPKEYQPVMRYGAGGALVYTGHIWPLTRAKQSGGGRVNAVFDFTPAKGGHVVAFGANANALSEWRSPMAHPAFVYMGPLNPVETDHVMALIDPDTPGWIVNTFNEVVPESFATLAQMFGFSPETKPNLFLAAPLGDDEGRLSYTGDALPAQFQIMLEGGAWREPSDKARRIFIFSTIHEAVHLWQAAARPDSGNAPEWIHEGAADAIAAEVMAALGRWDAEALAADETAARAECARELKDGSLNSARARGDFRALYACGHVIASAVGRAERKPAADFWRDFITRSEAAGGYDADLFYDLVADRTGDQDFANEVEDFARTPLADPKRAIDSLFAAAGTLARERGR
ncbi:MAG: hypothetical protein DHS20C04_31820 [Hyphococcus sp.]|nr:MAG: hypothetical protein DHS20C04_31820 [Marinicaulis sp.]